MDDGRQFEKPSIVHRLKNVLYLERLFYKRWHMQKIGVYFAPGFAVFAGVFGYVVASRLDQTTIATLGGVVIGLMAGLPFAALVTVIATRQPGRHLPDQPRQLEQPAYYAQIETPPAYARPLPLPWGAAQPARTFLMVGEDGGMREM